MQTKTILQEHRLFFLVLSVIGILFFSTNLTYAAITNPLRPSSEGTYSSWTPKTGLTHYTMVDESACNGATDFNSTTIVGNRDSYGINISAVPNGATITNIAITPCASRNNSGTGSSTLNVFYRYNGVNSAEAGSYALVNLNPATLPTTNFSGIALYKGVSSTLEVGARYAAGDRGVRLSRMAVTLTYSVASSVVSPTVVTASTTGISATFANINGSANPNGYSTIGWLRYSTISPGTCNTTFGTRAPVSGGLPLGSGTSSVNYGYSLAGLSSGTTYYYCALASNAGGTTTGTVQSFVTDTVPVPLTVETQEATGVTMSSSTLNGAVNAHGTSSIGWFRYSSVNPGTCNDSFGIRAPFATYIYFGPSTSSINYQYELGGLSPATTYFYCALAATTDGTSFGNITSFTTDGVAPSAPTGLDSYIGTSSPALVQLFWNDTSANEQGFKIFRSDDNVNFTIVGTTTSNTTYFAQTVLTAGTYYYKVAAYNASGDSLYSNIISVILP